MRRAVLLLAATLLPAVAGGQETDWRGPAALEIQVEDAKGKNLADAEIVLVYLSPDGGGSLPSVLTDAHGKANIGGLAAGRWTVEIRHAGHMSYRAELALSADGKPVVASAAHQMAPGATSTMKVKFARGRGGAVPLAPRPRAPEPPVAMGPSAREPAPAPRPPANPAARPAPAAALPAPAAAKAPVKEEVPAPPTKPAAEQPPSTPAPSVQPPASPAQPPKPAPAPLPEKAPQQPAVVPAKPPTTAPAPLPERAPQPSPAVPAQPPAPARPHLCVECPPGETAAWGEAAITGGAATGCPADLPARLKNVALEGVAQLSSELGPGCRVVRVEIPAGARFTGFRYEAQSQAVSADCLPGRACPAGDCRFPAEPVLRLAGNRTILLVGFESTAPDLRRAVVAGYSTYAKK